MPYILIPLVRGSRLCGQLNTTGLTRAGRSWAKTRATVRVLLAKPQPNGSAHESPIRWSRSVLGWPQGHMEVCRLDHRDRPGELRSVCGANQGISMKQYILWSVFAFLFGLMVWTITQ